MTDKNTNKRQRKGLLLNPDSDVGKRLAGADQTSFAKKVEEGKQPGVDFRSYSSNKTPMKWYKTFS